MVYKITFEDLVYEFNEYARVKLMRLVPEEAFDYSREEHPIEEYLAGEGIPYYFLGDPIEGENDYLVELDKLEIIYPE